MLDGRLVPQGGAPADCLRLVLERCCLAPPEALSTCQVERLPQRLNRSGAHFPGPDDLFKLLPDSLSSLQLVGHPHSVTSRLPTSIGSPNNVNSSANSGASPFSFLICHPSISSTMMSRPSTSASNWTWGYVVDVLRDDHEEQPRQDVLQDCGGRPEGEDRVPRAERKRPEHVVPDLAMPGVPKVDHDRGGH